MKNIAVVFGGKSVEHDISIITGLQVIQNLSEKFNIIPIYISRDGVWLTGRKLSSVNCFDAFLQKGVFECCLKPRSSFLFVKHKLITKKQKLDAIILALHGANGEDGSIQGFLELTQIPYVSSGVFGSSITMDKVALKMLLMQNGIKTPKFVYFYADEFQENQKAILQKIKTELGNCVVVKPARAGSSIGVKLCKTKSEIIEAVNVACCYDRKVIVEELITNFREINIALLGTGKDVKTSVLEEVVFDDGILSFDQKYLSDDKTKRIVGIKLDEIVEEKIKVYAKKAFYLCEMSGVCRMDFFVKEDEVLLNEINSIPGSMANYLFKDLSFCELLENSIKIAEQTKKQKDSIEYLYSSKALINFKNMCGKMKK